MVAENLNARQEKNLNSYVKGKMLYKIMFSAFCAYFDIKSSNL